MAILIVCVWSLSTVLLFNVVPGGEASNFPLADCSDEEVDVLALYYYYDDNDIISPFYQSVMCEYLVYYIKSFSSTEATPRVLFSQVRHTLAVKTSNLDIKSWRFASFEENVSYDTKEEQGDYLLYNTALEVLNKKVEFVQLLFSEMNGVRENATHIAVVFFDGAGWSSAEIRSLPQFVNQQNTDVKIFVVVLKRVDQVGIVHLRDIILLPHPITINDCPAVTMAICKQCMPGWIPFERDDGADSLTCYRLFNTTPEKFSWHDAIETCKSDLANLAAVETEAELKFLQTLIYDVTKEMIDGSEDPHDPRGPLTLVYIGLQRDSKSFARRFQWMHRTRPRPLVLNNWLPGKPSGGRGIACGMWQFIDVVNEDKSNKSISSQQESFVEGWVDVECSAKRSALALCEVVLPRRVEDTDVMLMSPSAQLSSHQALTQDNFVMFGGNIVSVSAQVENTHFVNFLKDARREFPVFDCGDDASYPQHVSWSYVCDHVDQCRSGQDEMACLPGGHRDVRFASEDDMKKSYINCDNIDDCVAGIDERNCEGQCTGIYCLDGSCVPLQWLRDGTVDCTTAGCGTETAVTDETLSRDQSGEENVTCALICNRQDCVVLSQLNDGVPDCLGPEGPLDETIGKLETAKTCPNELGDVWAPLCVYVRDRYGAVLGCRDLSHLKDCSHFRCPPGYFKCPRSYCVPLHYVTDGETHCPSGEDEQRFSIGSCSGNFACSDSPMCLHPDLICDGHPDCPRQDDETACDTACPGGFLCISGTVTVADYNRSIPFQDWSAIDSRTKYLDLSGLELVLDGDTIPHRVDKALVIKLSNCKIRNFLKILDIVSEETQTLDVSYNLIHEVLGSEINYYQARNLRHLNLPFNKEFVFAGNWKFTFLETLDLSYTGLSKFHNSPLSGLTSLRHLNLSHTLISGFSGKVFTTKHSLQTIDLRGMRLETFYEDNFEGLLILDHMYTDSFEVCCPQIRGPHILAHTCHAPEATISSCFDLVGQNVQRVLVWVVAVLAVLGNMTVIGYRVIWDRSVLATGYGLFVANLGISDFIMGVYLFIISGADYYYRDVYVLYEKSWRDGIVCRLAGFLATLSSETSTFFVFLIILDRFIVVKFPFGQFKFTRGTVGFTVLICWLVGVLLAIAPVVLRFGIYSSNGMCLGLPLTARRINGWGFSFGVFIVLNFFLFLVIAFGQIAIFRAMSENRITKLSSSPHRRLEDILVAKQLSLVALSNFLCWFPVGVMGLLSLGGHETSNDVYAWTTVIVLPINSAANPLLYTIPALLAKWDKFKHGGRGPAKQDSHLCSQKSGFTEV